MIGLCDGSMLGTALDLAQEMRAHGIPRNVYTFSALITACARAGEPGLALGLEREMAAEGVAANAVIFNSLIDLHAKGGRLEEALGILGKMEAQVCAVERRNLAVG